MSDSDRTMIASQAHALYETAVQHQAAGNPDLALAGYSEVLRLDPSFTAARRPLALLLVQAGRSGEAVEHVRAELNAGEEGMAWMTDAIIHAMQADDLRPAGELAAIFSSLRYGARSDDDAGRPASPEPKLSVGKLRHDVQQLRYLRSLGVVGEEMDGVIAGYEDVAKRLESIGREIRMPLSSADDERISDVYGRIVNVREAPRLGRALSDRWNSEVVQDTYLNHRPGVVVIDDFLTPDALDSLRRFCLESTVWLANRYPHGRLGAFFLDGFNCPLLLQIAEELRITFPRVIGRRHALRQLWGFKYPPHLPGDTTIHADFAAVNVNFWIMPDGANLDPSAGGLLVYDLDAPLSWDFATYNERLDMIKDFLRRNRPRVINIPYRENRAVIFNSDLFHATAEVNFRPEYEHRRVNITMLYGVRERDDHHSMLSAHSLPAASSSIMPPWRSAALSRSRRS